VTVSLPESTPIYKKEKMLLELLSPWIKSCGITIETKPFKEGFMHGTIPFSVFFKKDFFKYLH